MINSPTFLDRNSYISIEEIAKNDAEEMTRIFNTTRSTNGQLDFTQSELISFNLYLQSEEGIYEKKIANLKKLIEFYSSPEITSFLLKNHFLLDIIEEAVKKIKHLFRDEKLKLALERDPEISSDSGVLSLRISTKKSPKEALELLDKLNEEWWLQVKPRTKQKLIIEEEYE